MSVTMANKAVGAFVMAVVVALALSARVDALKTRTHLQHIQHPTVFLEKFMFTPGGTLNASVTIPGDKNLPATMSMGLFAVISSSNVAKFTFKDNRCPLNPSVIKELNANSTGLMFESFSLKKPLQSTSLEISRANHGVWYIYLIFCGPFSPQLSADVSLTLDNVDISGAVSYLSAGEIPLPWVYFYCGLVYLGLFLWWLRRQFISWKNVNYLHWLILALVFFKTIAILCQSFMYMTLSKTGIAKGWDIAFYVFHAVRALLLFVLILMIGSGWNMFKAFLSYRDRLLLLIVVPLQVIANVGITVCEEYSLRNLWFYIFHTLDIICCVLVLVPIIQNIETMQSRADNDDKARKILEKLTRIRHFYLIVVGYIYVTRVLSGFLSWVLPPGIAWVSNLIVEAATIALYVVTGYEFRPTKDNAYFQQVEMNEKIVDA